MKNKKMLLIVFLSLVSLALVAALILTPSKEVDLSQYQKTSLEIGKMDCEDCSYKIQKVLSRQKGVVHSEVSFENKQAKVYFDEQKVSPNHMIEAIQKEGFEASRKKNKLQVIDYNIQYSPGY